MKYYTHTILFVYWGCNRNTYFSSYTYDCERNYSLKRCIGSIKILCFHYSNTCSRLKYLVLVSANINKWKHREYLKCIYLLSNFCWIILSYWIQNIKKNIFKLIFFYNSSYSVNRNFLCISSKTIIKNKFLKTIWATSC